MAKANITKEFVEHVKPLNHPEYYWDTKLTGFGLAVSVKGKKSFCVQYRNQHNRTKKFTIGSNPPLTTAKARSEAERLLAEIALGADPSTERKHEKKKKIVTAGDMLDVFNDKYMIPSLAADEITQSYMDQFVQHRRKYLDPKFKNTELASVRRATLETYHREIKIEFGFPVAADGAIQFFVRAWAHVADIMEEDIPRAPSMKKFRYNKPKEHKTILLPHELAAVGEEMRRCREIVNNSYKVVRQKGIPQNRAILDAIEYLALVGTRKMEGASLQWSQIDWKTGIIDSTTKMSRRYKKNKTIMITDPVKRLLLEIRACQEHEGIETDFVFPANRNPTPFKRSVHGKTVLENFKQICKRAGVEKHMVIHDTRRTVVTHGKKRVKMSDEDMAMMMKQTQAIQNKFYAGEDLEADREATSLVTNSISGFMNTENTDDSENSTLH